MEMYPKCGATDASHVKNKLMISLLDCYPPSLSPGEEV